MEREPRTPLELAEGAVRQAEIEFERDPTDASARRLSDMRLWLASTKDVCSETS
jgi:hypothetical protein